LKKEAIKFFALMRKRRKNSVGWVLGLRGKKNLYGESQWERGHLEGLKSLFGKQREKDQTWRQLLRGDEGKIMKGEWV